MNINSENQIICKDTKEKSKLLIVLRAYLRLIPRLYNNGIPYWDKSNNPIKDIQFMYVGGKSRGSKNAIADIFMKTMYGYSFIYDKKIDMALDSKDAWQLMQEADKYNDFHNLDELGFVNLCFSHYCLTNYLERKMNINTLYAHTIKNYLINASEEFKIKNNFDDLVKKDIDYVQENLSEDRIKFLAEKELFWDDSMFLENIKWSDFKNHILNYGDEFNIFVDYYESLIFGEPIIEFLEKNMEQ